MYTLYYSPGACSMAVHVVLNELGVPFALERTVLAEGQNRTAAFLSINPRGQVPVLVDGQEVLREAGAILIYLLEKHASPLLPQSGRARSTAIEWLLYCNATLHPAYARGFFIMKNATDPAAKEQLLEVVSKNLNNLWSEVEERLSASSYLAGEQLTAADILLTVIANWTHRFPQVQLGPRTKALLGKVSSLPAYQKALEVERVQYRAAA